MENISFKQFIYTFNFRYYDDSKRGECNKEDTLIIRIHNHEEVTFEDCWFEFGIYDFSCKDTTWDYCCKFLNENVLNSYVDCIKFNIEENSVINIWITKEKNFID